MYVRICAKTARRIRNGRPKHHLERITNPLLNHASNMLRSAALEGAAYHRQEPVKFRISSTAHFSAVQAKPAAEVESWVCDRHDLRPKDLGKRRKSKKAKAVSPSLRLPAIRLLCIALLSGSTFSHAAA